MRSVVEALNLSLLYCQVTNWLVWRLACHMQNRTLQSVYSPLPFDLYKFVKDSLITFHWSIKIKRTVWLYLCLELAICMVVVVKLVAETYFIGMP